MIQEQAEERFNFCGADGKTGGSDGEVKGTGLDALGAENE